MPAKSETKEVSVSRYGPPTKCSGPADREPKKDFQPQVSHSRRRLTCPPPCAVILPPRTTRESKGKESLQQAMKSDNVELLWRYYMGFESGTSRMTNWELVQVGKKLTAVLIRRLKAALMVDNEEELRMAVEQADGRLQILNLGGLALLKEAKEKLDLNPDELPGAVAILGPASVRKVSRRAVATPVDKKPVLQNKRPSNFSATAETVASEDLGDGEGDAEEATEEGDWEEELAGESVEEPAEQEAVEEDAEEKSADEDSVVEDAEEESADEESVEEDALTDDECF